MELWSGGGGGEGGRGKELAREGGEHRHAKSRPTGAARRNSTRGRRPPAVRVTWATTPPAHHAASNSAIDGCLSSAWVTGVRKRGGKEQAPRAEGEAAEGETQDESPVPTACEATLCAGPPKGPGGTHEERSHAPAAAPTPPRAHATPAFLGPRPVACVRQPRPPDLASGGQAGRRALAAVEWDRAGSQKHTPQAQASAAPQPGRRRGRHAEHPKQGR